MKRLLRFPVQLLFGSAWGEEGWEWGTVLFLEYRTPEWLTVWACNWNVFLLFQHAGHVTITDGTVSMMDLRWSLSFVSPKHSQTVSSSWGKKHSFLFSGRFWADAGREFTIIMDLGCSQREQRCKRFSFYVFCSVKKIFHILLHFPNKQPAEGLVLGALCFCQCAVYFFPFVINKDVRSSVRDARLVTQTFLAPSSHFGFCLKDKVPRMRT